MKHTELAERFDLTPEASEALDAFVSIIRIKDLETYEHSVKVTKLLIEILEIMHLDPKVGLFTGLLHDIGKVQSDLYILRKKENFTEADLQSISRHVLDGHRILRGLFDFTADVILWHHEFQKIPYPRRMPKESHDYSTSTKILIPLYGRLLALADFYEAVHRPNDRYPAMSGIQIREIVEIQNEDLKVLVGDLYEAGIFDESLGTGYDATLR